MSSQVSLYAFTVIWEFVSQKNTDKEHFYISLWLLQDPMIGKSCSVMFLVFRVSASNTTFLDY